MQGARVLHFGGFYGLTVEHGLTILSVVRPLAEVAE